MKADIAQIVTDSILSAMEQGRVPWRKPWSAALTLPTSLTTGKAYRGINVLILNAVQMDRGYEHPLWVTYKQAESMGGQVQKGEKATPVVLWKPVEKDREDGTKDSFMLMRYFNVFNIAQTDLEIPAQYVTHSTPVPVPAGVEQALKYDPALKVQHVRNDKAFYSPSKDEIVLPALDQFDSSNDYAATALHEITHSTGHKSRLDRLTDDAYFGSVHYAEEELVAEIGSGMLSTLLGIDVNWNQSAAYLSSWLKVLKDDRSLIIKAAQKAQKAADLVTNTNAAP